MNRRKFLFGWTQRKPESAVGVDISKSTSFNSMYIKGNLVIDGTLTVTPPGNLNCQFSVGVPTPSFAIPAYTVSPGLFNQFNQKETPLELLIGERVDNV